MSPKLSTTTQKMSQRREPAACGNEFMAGVTGKTDEGGGMGLRVTIEARHRIVFMAISVHVRSA
jgi:hypothetical protein